MTLNDRGHRKLIADLEDVLRRAKRYEFDESRSDEPAPGALLVATLKQLIDNAERGRYDQ